MDLKDTLGTSYSTTHGKPAISGEQVTVYTSTGPQQGTMLGGIVTPNK